MNNPLSQYLADALVSKNLDLTTKMGLDGEVVKAAEPATASPVAQYMAAQGPSFNLPREAEIVEAPTQLKPSTANPSRFRGAGPDDASPELYSHISSLEQQYKLPAGILKALKDKGEKSGSNATSPVGAQGIFQFMPATWKQYGGDASPRDPFASANAAAKFVKDLLVAYNGNVPAAIAHYNGGTKQGKIVLSGGEPTYKETRDYVKRVTS